MNEHDGFAERASDFKAALVSHGFTPTEVAAMLGNFVLVCYVQQTQTKMPPEFYEMLTKTNRLSDYALAERTDG